MSLYLNIYRIRDRGHLDRTNNDTINRKRYSFPSLPSPEQTKYEEDDILSFRALLT